MKSTCWDAHATDLIIRYGHKDTEASVQISKMLLNTTETQFERVNLDQNRTIIATESWAGDS